MKRLNVTLPGGTYPIFIEEDCLKDAGTTLLSLCPNRRTVIVSDQNVWALHGIKLRLVLQGAGIDFSAVVVEPGEKSKSMSILSTLYSAFFKAGLSRNDPVIAFGGGVVCDLTGFAAATYMRGVPLIQIPTTLLAQTDAGVGGKVAVNLPEGKNLAGCFYQPKMVLADPALTRTLPRRDLLSGMAEVVKYAVIGERSLLTLLETEEDPLARLADVVYLCCKSKAAYVETDERDHGARRMLNFGHTFGHAIEKLFRFETYTHGEAVAMGMRLAVQAGAALGITPAALLARLDLLYERLGLQGAAPVPAAQLVPLMAGDKKNGGDGMITLVLLSDFGKPLVQKAAAQQLLDLHLAQQ